MKKEGIEMRTLIWERRGIAVTLLGAVPIAIVATYSSVWVFGALLLGTIVVALGGYLQGRDDYND